MTALPRNILEGIHRAPYPIYATDENNRINAWNRAAEQLLGHAAEEALGKPCHALIRGKDIYGNDACSRECNVFKMVRRNAPVKPFDLDVRCVSGDRTRVHCAILVLPGSSSARFSLLHLLEGAEGAAGRPTSGGRASGPHRPPRPASSSRARAQLTPREQQVLRLLATGAKTRGIADSLFISPATVKTHVRNILDKLHAHSRLEAVMNALRDELI